MSLRNSAAQITAASVVIVLLLTTVPASHGAMNVNNWHCAEVYNVEYYAFRSQKAQKDTTDDYYERENCIRGQPRETAHYSVGVLDKPELWNSGIGRNTEIDGNIHIFGGLRVYRSGYEVDSENLCSGIARGETCYTISQHINLVDASTTPFQQKVTVYAAERWIDWDDYDCSRVRSNGYTCVTVDFNVWIYNGASSRLASLADPSQDDQLDSTNEFKEFVRIDPSGDTQLEIAGLPQTMDPGDVLQLSSSVSVSLTQTAEGERQWRVYTNDGSNRVFLSNEGKILEFLY